MAEFTVTFPTAEEENRARAFQVHLNYISAIASYLLDNHGPDARLIVNLTDRQRDLGGYKRIRTSRPENPDALRRFLSISWASELQLRLATWEEHAALRYSNVWAPAHAYYAIYMSMQAWFSANKMSHLAEDHSASLRTISNQISSREIFPRPWSVSCDGCPQLQTVQFHGLPEGADPQQHVEVLANPSPATFWPRFCKLLETTRRPRLERNFTEWKRKKGRKAMWKKDKLAVSKNLAATTLFDFFWRLRVRSNYRDVSSFLAWSVPDRHHVDFRHSLITITHATCALLESLVVARSGGAVYDRLSANFLEGVSESLSGPARFLEERRRALLG